MTTANRQSCKSCHRPEEPRDGQWRPIRLNKDGHCRACVDALAEVTADDRAAETHAVPRRRGRGPQKAPTKQPINLRLDRDVLEAYKATGPGWQLRMREAIAKAAPRRAKTSRAR